ncbi:MAG: hypothetical protein F6K58_03465 [Symploca sp. SIO2E9]|nr:hypothetical protein [Symploca sp. SIO2E9]
MTDWNKVSAVAAVGSVFIAGLVAVFTPEEIKCFLKLKINNCPSTTGKLNNSKCFDVSSKQGWQSFELPSKLTRIVSIEGYWSVDDKNYRPVSAEGHTGEAAKKLEPYNQYKYDQRFPFGALLVDIPQYHYIWISQPQQLPRPTAQVSMRINDDDNTQSDNAGSLRVCFGL